MSLEQSTPERLKTNYRVPYWKQPFVFGRLRKITSTILQGKSKPMLAPVLVIFSGVSLAFFRKLLPVLVFTSAAAPPPA